MLTSGKQAHLRLVAASLPEDIKESILALHREGIGDFTYAVREREVLGWDGPRVKAWSDASAVIARYAELLGELP